MNLYKNTIYIILQSKFVATLPKGSEAHCCNTGWCSHTIFLAASFHKIVKTRVVLKSAILITFKTQMLLHGSRLIDMRT